jgi:hypothetical protein
MGQSGNDFSIVCMRKNHSMLPHTQNILLHESRMLVTQETGKKVDLRFGIIAHSNFEGLAKRVPEFAVQLDKEVPAGAYRTFWMLEESYIQVFNVTPLVDGMPATRGTSTHCFF